HDRTRASCRLLSFSPLLPTLRDVGRLARSRHRLTLKATRLPGRPCAPNLDPYLRAVQKAENVASWRPCRALGRLRRHKLCRGQAAGRRVVRSEDAADLARTGGGPATTRVLRGRRRAQGVQRALRLLEDRGDALAAREGHALGRRARLRLRDEL